MSDKRSIQDIIPPARSKPIRPASQSVKPSKGDSLFALPPKNKKPPNMKRGGSGFFGLVGIALAVLVIVVVAFGVVSIAFHRADVTISLQSFIVPIAETFEASPEGVLLSFTERTVSESLTKTVPRSSSEFVEERASGVITVFNAHSTGSQRLITNTRFESSNGLIYRVKNPVVVPGYKTVGGSISPGEIEVTVYADESGEQYNRGPSDFTIPGLKGTNQFETMYARSRSAISGGFVGERAVVSPEVRDSAIADLKSELDRKVRESMKLSLQADEIFFPDTLSISFIEQPDRASENGALVTLTAEARAPVFAESKLARVIAEEGGIQYEHPLAIENVGTLAIQTEDAETEGNLSLTISGEAKLVGDYDQTRLLHDLAGKDRRNVGVVLSGYPAIADMKISVYPFWRGILPEDVSHLTIHIASDEAPE